FVCPVLVPLNLMSIRCRPVYPEGVSPKYSVLGPTTPVGSSQHLHFNIRSDIDQIVVHDRVFCSTQVECATVVVSADVVPDNRSHIPDILLWIPLAWCTNQHEATFIVVAVVVLKERVTRVEVRIESFAIKRGVRERSLVQLKEGIICAPRP